MANSLTTSIMKNISKKSNNNNCNKDKKEKVINNFRENEEEILRSILHKNKSKNSLTYSENEEENIITNKEIIEKTSINDLISKSNGNSNTNNKDDISNKPYSEEKENYNIKSSKSKVKIQSLKSLANNNQQNEELDKPKQKTIKKITSLRDLAK